MLVESNVKIQDALRGKLKELGYRVLILGDARRAITRFENLDPSDERPADCVIFSCAGLGRVGLEAFDYFAKSDFSAAIPSIVLIPGEYKKLASQLELGENRIALSLPLKFKNVRKALGKLLSNETAS